MAVNNSLAKTNQRMGITAFLSSDAVQKQINTVVGGKNGTKFVTSVVSAVNANSALQECTNSSILSAALLGEALNLSPSPQLGHYYMVPFNDKEKGKVAQFQLGYKGYLQLAIRSGQYKKLNVLPIKEGELRYFDPLNEDIEVNLIEDEESREKAKTIGYYAMFEYINGFKKAIYWSKDKMLSHADKYSAAFSRKGGTVNTKKGEVKKVSYEDYANGKYSKSDEWLYSSFWYKDFDGMACKTMLRQLISKWGIMSIDMQTAFEKDMAVINEDGSATYVDDSEIIDMPAVEVEKTTPAADDQANEAAKALFGDK